MICDSHLTRIKKDRFRKISKEIRYMLNILAKQLGHFVIPMLADEKQQNIVTHIRSSYITKFNYHNVKVNHFIDSIVQIGLKCRYYGVESTVILSCSC